MRVALVRNGVVENVVLADESYAPEDGVLALPSGPAGPGWLYDGEAFHPPAEPPPQEFGEIE